MDKTNLIIQPGADQDGSCATFFLVHGTWAQKARWTKPSSALRQRLLAEFPGADVEAICWSGRNRFADRLRAAQEVERIGMNRLADGRALFLIGHSHGGSAIVYALRRSGILRRGVAGAIFMGTPFLALATRPGYRVLQRALIVVTLTILFVLGSYIGAYFTQTGSWDDTLWRDFLGVGLAAAVGSLCLAIAIYLWRSSWFDRRWERVREQAQHFDTTHAPEMPMLFLRTTGDEVAMVIGFLQLLCFISNLISNTASMAINSWTALLQWCWSRMWGKALMMVLGMATIVAAAMIGIMSRVFGFFVYNSLDFLNPFTHTWGLDAQSAVFARALEFLFRGSLFLIDPLLAALALAGALMLLGLVVALVSSTIALLALGRFDPLGALALEMAAEPTPRGMRSFVHLPWDERLAQRSSGGFRLRHSEPYADPAALAAVCQWVRRELHSRASISGCST